MELAQTLADLLKKTMTREKDLLGWRFDLHQMEGLEIGLKNNRIGGPYTAPSYKQSTAGELYLIWRNNRFTTTKIDSATIQSFADSFPVWHNTSYYDPEGVGLFTPESLPEVELADPNVNRILEEDFVKPYELLERGLQKLPEFDAVKIDGKVKCYRNDRALMNSEGFRAQESHTPVEFYFEVNDSHSEGYGEKKWPNPQDVERIIGNTGRIGQLLSRDTNQGVNGKTVLLFPPSIFESLLSHFLITNLYGSLVINRQSRFSLSDFQEQKQVLRDDLSIEVNNLLPFRSFSYRCTSEGVPGGQLHLVSDGRLQTPAFNLKYAKKAGMRPTPLPGGGFFVQSAQPLPTWEELIRDTKDGLIVYSLLGLHTQDATSGSFSLTADQALRVRDGEILGKTKAVISGDFLASLHQTESRLGSFAGEDNPGYAMTAVATT